MRLTILAVFALAVGFPSAVAAYASAPSVKVKVLEVRVSPNADCSHPIRVYSNAAVTPQDLTSNPALGNGMVPNGTYRCVMYSFSDQITFTTIGTGSFSLCPDGGTYTSNIYPYGTT